jgi:methionyl aminopeptidase
MVKGKAKIYNEQDFAMMRKAGKLAAQTLDHVTPFVKVGAKTIDLNQICHDFIVENGAIPACVGYRGYEHATCISINHVICHGIPSEKTLKNGDIVNIDVTVILDGYFGDTSRMFTVGKVGVKGKRLIKATYDSLMKAIDVVRPGATLGDIGHAIQSHVAKFKYSVVEDFCGHGIGKVFHDYPNVLHYGNKGEGDELVEGMIFTIEPMINVGKPDSVILSDGWTAITRDRTLSAQFEHTIGVTADGYEIFTLSPKNWHFPPYE